MISVTVEGVLTIDDHPGADLVGLWLPEDALGRPERTWERQEAVSPFVHGSVTTRARLQQSSIPLTVMARAASTAALATLMASLEDAVSTFSYTVTLTIDGVASSYICDPADISWGQVDSGVAKAFMARATLTIPCYPLAGSGGATTGLYVVAPTVPLP